MRIVVLCALLVAAPATAQTSTSTITSTAVSASSPASSVSTSTPGTAAKVAAVAPVKQKLVCEDQGETGSRLSHHRICKTPEEWRESRLVERGAIERAQLNRPASGN